MRRNPKTKTEDVGGRPGIRPGMGPTNEGSHDHSPRLKEKEEKTGLTAGLTSLSTREGERSRRTRKAFVGRQRRKREPRGGPERWLHGRRKGYRSGRTS